jgi:hypothetical protein
MKRIRHQHRFGVLVLRLLGRGERRPGIERGEPFDQQHQQIVLLARGRLGLGLLDRRGNVLGPQAVDIEQALLRFLVGVRLLKDGREIQGRR